MQTRKYPRTMQEAFGPYTDHEIVEPVYDRPDAIVLWVCTLAAAVLAVLALVGWLK